MIRPLVMQPSVVSLASGASDGTNGRRFIAYDWDGVAAVGRAHRQVQRPRAWPQRGLQVEATGAGLRGSILRRGRPPPGLATDLGLFDGYNHLDLDAGISRGAVYAHGGTGMAAAFAVELEQQVGRPV